MKTTNHIYGIHWTAAFGLPFVVLCMLVALACHAFGGDRVYLITIGQEQSAPSQTNLFITGSSTADEDSTEQYTAWRLLDNGNSNNVSASAVWTEDSTDTTINAGLLTVGSLTENGSVNITASYGGFSDTNTVTLLGDDDATGLQITGASSITESNSAQYSAYLAYESGTSNDVAGSAVWDDGDGLANVTLSAGLVTVGDRDTTNDYTFTATYGGFAATNTISIVGTPETPPEAPPVAQTLYPDLNVTEPAGITWIGFSAYDPPVTNTASTAVIAEWNRFADDGESLVYTTESAVTGLVVIGATETNIIASTDHTGYGRATMLEDGFKMVWPVYGATTGTPVRLNNAIAWWASFNSENYSTFSIYGQNLGPTTKVWCAEEQAWVTAASSDGYKATFNTPGGWTNGVKTLYAHNGSGRKYGLAEEMTLTLADAIGYTTSTSTVAAVTEASLKSTISGASANSTVIVPDGTYLLTSSLDSVPDNIKIMGTNAAVIKVDNAYVDSTALVNLSSADGITFSGLTFHGGDADTTCPSLIDLSGANTVIENCTLTHINLDGNDTARIANISGTSSGPVFFRNNELIQNEILEVYNYVQYHSNTNLGRYQTSKLVQIKGHDSDYSDGFARHYEFGVETNSCESRYLVCQGSSAYHVYLGNNTTTNLKQVVGQNNSGEQILFENTYAAHEGTASSGTSNTLVATYFTTNSTSGYCISITDGTGFGQTRPISSIDTGTGTATVLENWNVNPDNTSVFIVHKTGWRGAIVGNYLDGLKDSNNTASAGVSFYGGPCEFVIENNTANQTEDGFITWQFSYDTPVQLGPGFDPPALIEPAYFNVFNNNAVTDPSVHTGTSFGEGGLAYTIQGIGPDTVTTGSLAAFGTIYKNSTFANAYRPLYVSDYQAHITNSVDPNFETAMTVFEHISGTSTNAFWLDTGINTYTNNLTTTVIP